MARKTNPNKSTFSCMYVLGNGHTHHITKVVAENVCEATQKIAGLCELYCKRKGIAFDANAVLSITVMKQPEKPGRKAKA